MSLSPSRRRGLALRRSSSTRRRQRGIARTGGREAKNARRRHLSTTVKLVIALAPVAATLLQIWWEYL